MGKKLVWFESYTTICKYSTELTDEEAKLFVKYNVPTRLITITYNNETIESYE